MALDWKDLTREDRLTFLMVSPTSLNDVYGELEGVDLSNSSLDAAYYTDVRTSGTLSVVGDGWVRGSLIRVVHEVPSWGWKRTIGTYIVTDDMASRSNGVWRYDLTLQSMLYGLSTDLLVRPWTIAKNAMALKAMRDCLNAAVYKHTIVSGANDYKLKTPQVMESGTSRLACLYSLCTMANDRLDVNPNGYVTVSKYVKPASLAPSARIDLSDPRGIALDDLSRSTDWLQMVDTAAVSFKYSDTVKKNGKSTTVQKEINAYAKVSSSLHQAHGVRGFTVTDFRSLSELTPQTAARAQQLANQYLKENAPELVTWELTTTYLPVWEGDVVELVVHDGLNAYQGIRKCLVRNVELDLGTMTMHLTLKETASGDKGDTDGSTG